VDLRHCFNGPQSKENAASAWLATLLDYDPAFRAESFKVVPPVAGLDPAADWTADVETPLNGPCDLTLETAATFVFLEDKIAASARMDRQFVRYSRPLPPADPTSASLACTSAQRWQQARASVAWCWRVPYTRPARLLDMPTWWRASAG
jgi:hypothetical protein